MAMKFCENCGAQLPDGVKFCTECGSRVETVPVVQRESSNVPETETTPSGVEQYAAPAYEEPVRARSTVEERPLPPEPEVAEARPERKNGKKSGLLIGAVAAAVLVAAAGLLLFFGGGEDPNPDIIGPDVGATDTAKETEATNQTEPTAVTEATQAGNSVQAGYYELIRVDSENSDEAVSAEDLQMMHNLNLISYLELKDDGTGEFSLFGEEAVTLTWDQEKVDFEEEITSSFVLDGEELSFEVEGATYVFIPAEPVDNQGGLGINKYDWWAGDWYGWWIVRTATGAYETLTDSGWDAYATIEVNEDDTGRIVIWDVDCSKEDPLSVCDVVFQSGLSEYGCMVSESGYFDNMEIAHADWMCDPDVSSVSEFEDMIAIESTYVNTDDPESTMEYMIILRPWGLYWEDVRNADTSNSVYTDMLPFRYDAWYLPLLALGVTEMPDSYNAGLALLPEQNGGGITEATESTGEPNEQTELSGTVGEYGIKIAGAEHFVDSDGKDCIRVYYDFTNNSAQTTTPYMNIDFDVTQDGYEAHIAYPGYEDMVEEYTNNGRMVRPGCSVRAIAEYSMKVDGGPVEFVFYDFWNEESRFEVQFDPANLPGRPAQSFEIPEVWDPQWLTNQAGEGVYRDMYYIEIAAYQDTVSKSGNDLLRVYFNFTNNSEEAVSMWWATMIYAYQDGIQVYTEEPAERVEEDDNLMVDVEPGQTISASICFDIRNDHPLEVEILDSWEGKDIGRVLVLNGVG